MTRLRIIQIGLAAALAAGSASAQDAEAVWSLDGLATPESVVHDPARDVLYVSSVSGAPTEKNGTGYLSIVSPEGAMIRADWVNGLHAPKGLVLDGDTLYVTDIDRLVAIDVGDGTIAGTWDGEGAIFLNDPAIAPDGRVFVSDMIRGAIYVLDGDTFEVWLEDEELQHPNGLAVSGDRLIVAPWGRGMQEDFTTLVGGHLLAIDLETRAIAPLGSGEPVGNLDGLEPDGAGGWLVTDWIAGGLLRIAEDGSHDLVVDLPMGSADHAFLPGRRLVVIPMMMDDKLIAVRIE